MADDVVIRRILVGADPSPGAEVALRWAVSLASRCDAEVVVVHARGLLEAAREHAGAPDADAPLPAWLAEQIERIDPGVSLTLQVLLMAPAEALLHAAAEHAVDLIVVGRRGAGSPFELTLGSTSREVSSRATVPVLVVPAA